MLLQSYMAQLNYITSRMNTKRLLWNINGLEPKKKKKRCRRKNITVMGILFKRALLVRRLITKLLLAIQYMNQRWRQRHDWETLIVLSLVHFFLFSSSFSHYLIVKSFHSTPFSMFMSFFSWNRKLYYYNEVF